MHRTNTHPRPVRHPLRVALACVALLTSATVGLAMPASAQYGGGPNVFVDPVLVEIDGTFDAIGFNCPGASMVTISIDGFPGTLGQAPANDDNSYNVGSLDMPDGVIAGQEYTVRATCDGETATTIIRATCNDGSLPVDGTCPDGVLVGGGDPDPTVTTTTTPGAVTTTIPGTGTTGGQTPSGGGSSPALAVTGASFAEQAMQVGITLVAVGAILVLVTARRRDDAATA